MIFSSFFLAIVYFKVSSANAPTLLSKFSGHTSASLSGTAREMKATFPFKNGIYLKTRPVSQSGMVSIRLNPFPLDSWNPYY
jgi:hypothetical protein